MLNWVTKVFPRHGIAGLPHPDVMRVLFADLFIRNN
jgi:hypothetical protein